MGRNAEPWFWTDRDGWYAVVRGKRRLLAKGKAGKAEARRVLIRILAEEDLGGAGKGDTLDLHALIDLFLARVDRECAPSTLAWYKIYLDPFAGRIGAIPSGELKPKHLDRWIALDGSSWSDSTRRGAITAVKAVTSWAARQGHLTTDPLKAVPRPRMGRRIAIAPEAAPAILESAGDQAFTDLLIALFESGCRPGEVYKVTAEDVDPVAGTWTIIGKTTRRTGKNRVIQMTPRLAEVVARLVASYPTGPLFRNSDGNPWTRNAVRCRFRRRRATLGPLQAYGFRHLYGTDALVRNNVPVAVVAELMGHGDLKMLSEHYGHVDERRAALREAARSIRPPSDGDTEASGETP